MTTLQLDNRTLLDSSKYTYLVTNYASGVSSLSVLNATDTVFAEDAYLLLGNFGSESAEIVQIDTVNNSTGAITLTSSTKFAHSESTRVSILPYNQVGFYWTPTEIFGISTPLSGYVNIQPSDWFSTYDDIVNPTGFGWGVWYNSTTTNISQESNSLPYVGFETNSIEDILNDFYSLLSNKELKLVTRRDALSWFNEGYSIMRNRLNLSNTEFSASIMDTITLVPGTTEYLLPDNFYQLISITSGMDQNNINAPQNFTKEPIEYISLNQAPGYTGSQTRYYIRGKYIGIIPTPQGSDIFNYMYLTKTTRLVSNSDGTDLPDNGEYVVKDFMMMRACQKFKDWTGSNGYLKSFTDGLNAIVVASIDRDANKDTMGIETYASV